MSILEAQAGLMELPMMELPMLDSFEGCASNDVPPVRAVSSPPAEDDDIPPGTAGRAAALGLRGRRASSAEAALTSP